MLFLAHSPFLSCWACVCVRGDSGAWLAALLHLLCHGLYRIPFQLTFMLIFVDLTHITTQHNTRTRTHESGIPLCTSNHSAFITISISLGALRISHSCSFSLPFRSFLSLDAGIDSRAQHIHKLVSRVYRTHSDNPAKSYVFFFVSFKERELSIQSGFSRYGMRSSAWLALQIIVFYECTAYTCACDVFGYVCYWVRQQQKCC